MNCHVPGCTADAGDRLFCRAHHRYVSEDDWWSIRMAASSPMFGRGDLVSDKHRDAIVEAWGPIDGHEVVWAVTSDGSRFATRGVRKIAQMMRVIEYWMVVADIGESVWMRSRTKVGPEALKRALGALK